MMGFGLLGVVLLVGALIIFMREGSSIQGLFGTNNYSSETEENAQQILDKRYARGELNRDEYKKMKGDLQG